MSRQIVGIEASIVAIEANDIFQIKKRVIEAEKQGVDLLKQMAQDIETEIAEATTYLEQLKNEAKLENGNNYG